MDDGTERWDYAWVSPQEIPERSRYGWSLPHANCWNESNSIWWNGKLLMERRRVG